VPAGGESPAWRFGSGRPAFVLTPSSRRGKSGTMTMLYLANCLAITFVPPWMIYKYKL